ncbi:murein L,D-transpeptidase catalytic domain family protein [uncultured Planktosalinus sp.]|uniref:murein L,D-transpeptidase catalytic domain family protein n=1 Tax=uncultured Planktosalinus sp. TaxID=1810935 RepID=UPI0030DAD3D6
MTYRLIPVLLLCLLTFTTNSNTAKVSLTELPFNTLSKAELVYENLNAKEFDLPSFPSFTQALNGYFKLKETGKLQKSLLTVVDFSLSANEKRLWVIDLELKEVLYQTYVAHGRNTGSEYAKSFSNVPESFQSSLGFYATAETYYGKHGYSLRLDGLESGINDKARERAIVIHGADYATENFIKTYGRLGRSLGCPSLPQEESETIINTIKEKSCLFIYFPSDDYVSKSQLI